MRNALTMLIISKDRQFTFREILKYHAQIDIPILIADASDNTYKDIDELAHSENITYFHMPHTSFHERFFFLAHKATTPYCVVRGDRRHQSNHAITSCLNFLQTNHDFTSASGIWCVDKTLGIQAGHDIFTEPWSINDPVKRVECHALSMQPPFYNVHKTHLAQLRCRIIRDILQHTTHTYFIEYIDYFSMFFLGKTMQLALFGGIVQHMTERQAHYNEFYHCRAEFQDQKLLDHVYAIIEKNMKHDGFETSQLKKAFDHYIKCTKIRLLFYGIPPHNQDPFQKVSRHGYVEDALDMLLDRKEEDLPFLKHILQAALAYKVDSSFLLGDIVQRFSGIDNEEILTISQMIEKIIKSQLLEQCRHAKARLKNR